MGEMADFENSFVRRELPSDIAPVLRMNPNLKHNPTKRKTEMHISIEHIDGKYPSFNVALSSKEGTQPFLVVKGCRIVDGQNGQFVSGPATKNQTTGKYWNHTYFNEQFAAAVLEKALGQEQRQAPAPKAFKPASQDAFKARQLAPQQYDNDEPPF